MFQTHRISDNFSQSDLMILCHKVGKQIKGTEMVLFAQVEWNPHQ